MVKYKRDILLHNYYLEKLLFYNMSKLHFFFKILILLSTACLSGQTFDDDKFINFTIENGLPSNEVYEIFEDSNGYIWVATDRGVSRYNGYEFTTFTTEDGLPDNTIFNFYEDKVGRIWVFSFNGKVGFYFNNEFRTLNIKIPYKHIRGVVSRNDTIEVFYNKARLLKFTLYKNKATDVYWKNGNKDDYKRIIDKGKYKYGVKFNDSTYLMNTDGILKLSNNSEKLKNKITGLNNSNGIKLLTTSNGFIEEISVLKKGVEFKKRVRLKGFTPSSATKDKFGGLWVSTLNKGILYCSNIEVPIKHFNETVKGKGLLRYFSNQQFEIIVNNNKELFVKENNECVKIDNLSGNMGDINFKAPYAIIDSKNKAVKINVSNGKVVKYDANFYRPRINGLNSFQKLESPNVDYVSCHSNKICFLNDSSCVEVKGAKRLTRLLQQKDTLWTGGLEGLFAISLKNRVQLSINRDTIFNYRVNYLSKLNDNLLVATRGNGLYIKKGKQVISIKEKDGLIANSLSKIITNGNNTIWVSSNKGISKVKFTSFSPLQYTIENITKENGLLSLKINDLQYYNHKILVLTDELLYEFSEELPVLQHQLNFYIKNIKVNGKTVNTTNLNNLNYKQNNIEIDYEGLYYPNPKELYYKYSTDNGSNWKDVNTLKLNFLNLPHGEYSFLLKAVTSKGLESRLRKVEFKIAPPFWRTTLFLLSGIFTLLTTVGMIVKYVIKQHRMKRKVVEMELKALKSQMNPHFSFNSMNSIQSFILENKQDEALSFIAKYSKLVRLILNNSSKASISLQEELDALKLYLDIEQVRLNNKFSYSIVLDKELDADYINIPSMILQPYVENAIWHGISNIDGKGVIKVCLSVKNNLLICSIEDNGAGRLKAQELRSKRNIKHKSFGLDITKERLQLINSSKKRMGVKIIDLFDENMDPSGTRVEIKILISSI